MIDHIYYNAKIYTFEADLPHAEAVACANGKIVAVGTKSEILALPNSKTADKVDLGGATLIPGLNDAHTHLLWFAKSLQKVNLSDATTLEIALERVLERVQLTPTGSWISGLGWNKNLWGEAFPTRYALDKVAPAHPVALSSKDGHLLWVNSQALKRCGITTDSHAPAGGEIERDSDGELTGIFKETACSLIYDQLEFPDPSGDYEQLKQALPLVYKAGLTAVQTMEDPDGFAALQRLRENDLLKVRTTVLHYNQAASKLIELGFRQGFGDKMLRLGQIKFFLDGTLGSQTAAMFEPYEHDDCENANVGILRLSEADFLSEARHCVANGFGVAVHVIGDRAARIGLDTLEKVMDGADLPPQVRNRLEHLQLLKAADLPRLAALGIVASVQPTHATTDRDTAEHYWGLARLQESGRGYAYKSMLASGAVLALGSDVPIEPIEPLRGIQAAVTRKSFGEGDERDGWLPQECLSVQEAIAGFSSGAAYAVGEENWRGKIKTGFAADFTVLGQNIFEVNPAEIANVGIVATIVAGEPVFRMI